MDYSRLLPFEPRALPTEIDKQIKIEKIYTERERNDRYDMIEMIVYQQIQSKYR